jgi:hypothetical protein
MNPSKAAPSVSVEAGRRDLDLLVSPAFLGALALLLANDLVLKAALGNGVTGKLSDFAGGFAFAVFWMALLPRHRAAVCWTVGAAFALWKSPLATPVIGAWNVLPLFDVARVVDYGDLAALLVLPMAYRYRPAPRMRLRALRPALALLAILAFAATSRMAKPVIFNVPAEYPFRFDRAKLLERLQLGASDRAAHYRERGYVVDRTDLGSDKDHVVLSVMGECQMIIEVELIDRPGGGSVLRLRQASGYDCQAAEEADPEPYVRTFFERYVLRNVPGSGFGKEEKEETAPPPPAPAPPAAPVPSGRDGIPAP